MNAATVDAFRSGVFEAFETVVHDAARRVAASTDADRVVVVVDPACDSGRNFVRSMNHGTWMDEWREDAGGVWCGVIRRGRLLAFLNCSWPSATGTRAALEAAAPVGTVWGWVLANNGSQLRHIFAGGGSPENDHNPLPNNELDWSQRVQRTRGTLAPAPDACRGEADE
jgi:hypothetical protein